LTGYGINRYFLLRVGDAASPSTVYASLASLERKGWIECITDRRGRVYALTAVGGRIVDEMPESVEKIKEFIDKLLKV
jgi:DNA-binding PadR family transcriptional regulator